MADILLISEEFIKNNSQLDENISSKLLFPIIVKVQNKYIKPLLGADMYNDICTQVDNSGTSIDTHYAYLMDNYISWIILYYTVSEYIVDGSFKFRMKGVGKHNDEFFDQNNDFKWLVKRYEEDAEMFAQRMINYICYHHSIYPKYTTTDSDDVKPIKEGYNTGWSL